MTLIHRRWWAATAAGGASTMLATACGVSGGGSALATITPASPQKPAGYAGTSGPPSPLATAMPSMSGMPSAAPGTASAAKPVAANAVSIRNCRRGRGAAAARPARLVCPCHGATFALDGTVLAHKLPIPLEALPRIEVREAGGAVQVYAPLADL